MVKEYRPRIRVARTLPLWVSDIVAFGGILWVVALLLLRYADLPDTIATHFGFDGRADSWGSKSSIIALPIVSLSIVTGLGILERFPHVYNYSVPLNERNALTQYGIAVSLLASVKALVSVMFAYLTHAAVQSALASAGRINAVVLFSLVALLFADLAWHIGRSLKAR